MLSILFSVGISLEVIIQWWTHHINGDLGNNKSDTIIFYATLLHCYVFNRCLCDKVGASVRANRPSLPEAQRWSADGGRSACGGRRYTLWQKTWGREGMLFNGSLNAAARLREPISDTSLPLQAPSPSSQAPLLLVPASCTPAVPLTNN